MSQNKFKEIKNGIGTTNNKVVPPEETPNSNGELSLSARKAALTPLEYRVTQQRETERPFSNKYNKFWETGTYHCIVCNEELFKSETKFESKSGWPAFYNVVDPQKVKLTPDLSHVGANLLLLVAKPDLARTEVSCANCNAHLGHLFKDGPKPTGLRYCINSASLSFRSSDGEIRSVQSPTGITNGNSNGYGGQEIKEYLCNPENTCSRQAFTPSPPPNHNVSGNLSKSLACTPTDSKSFCGRGINATARENFFSSMESNCNSLPPMGALCLNNQSCQRIPFANKKPTSSEDLKKSMISNGAENQNANTNGLNNIANSNHKLSNKHLPSSLSSSTNRNGTGICTTQVEVISPTSKTNANTNKPDQITSTKSRFPFSKGASLTAARINFFQKIATSKDSPSSPSRWAVTFNSKWSPKQNSNFSTSPLGNNTHNSNRQNGQEKIINNLGSASSSSPSSSRFPSSCSSGSLCTVSQQPRPADMVQPRRSTSSFFAKSSNDYLSNSNSHCSIEQVSISPKTVALRETTL